MNDLVAKRATLQAALSDAGLDGHTEAILAVAEPAVSFSAVATPDLVIPSGASKAGGSPDVPADFSWPEHKGTPLAFLLQIRLDDLGSLPTVKGLPQDGLLSVFYENEEQPWGGESDDAGSTLIVWFPSNESLHRTLSPGDALPSCRLEFGARLSLPDTDAPAFEALGLTNEEENAFIRVCEEQRGKGPQHQIGGTPQSIQSHVLTERQYFTKDDDSSWRLLLQLDSDDETGTMWGDTGMLYFMIREDDLLARSFEAVQMILQCC